MYSFWRRSSYKMIKTWNRKNTPPLPASRCTGQCLPSPRQHPSCRKWSLPWTHPRTQLFTSLINEKRGTNHIQLAWLTQKGFPFCHPSNSKGTSVIFLVHTNYNTNLVFGHLKARKIIKYYYGEVEFKTSRLPQKDSSQQKESWSSQLVRGYYGVRSLSDRAPHGIFPFVCFVQMQCQMLIIRQSTTIDYDCNSKAICFKCWHTRKLASLERTKKQNVFPVWITVNGQLEHGYFGTYSDYDAHPLAFIGEGEYLQDGEVQYLATRGPQLHWGLVSSN